MKRRADSADQPTLASFGFVAKLARVSAESDLQVEDRAAPDHDGQSRNPSPVLPTNLDTGSESVKSSNACIGDSNREFGAQAGPSSSNSAVHSNDLGLFSGVGSIADSDRRRLLTHVWRPGPNHAFPKREQYGCKRSFRYQWLAKYPWLTYSQMEDGGFCVPCVLFVADKQPLGQLVRTPMVNFARASTTLADHSVCKTHVVAMERQAEFMALQSDRRPTVVERMVSQHEQVIAKNRAKLRSLLKCIVLCGRQNIALRGHRNETWDPQSGEAPSENPGNFLSLVHFRIDAGDSALTQEFSLQGPGPKNVTYRTPRVQNELLTSIQQFMQGKIVSKIRAAKFFAICADEGTDSANKEQMPVVLRYLDMQRLEICEDFVAFVECEDGTTGQALADGITNLVESLGLPLADVRGQCYDGASNMSGRTNGAAALIRERCGEKAHYTHCMAHCLNLCIVEMSQVKEVQCMWATLKELALFFDNSPKRQQCLKETIEASADVPGVHQKHKLVDLCKTRWIARHNSLTTFRQLFQPIVATLETISATAGWSAETSTKAAGLLTAVTKFGFLTTMMITSRIMAYTLGISYSLQSSCTDIYKAYEEVDSVVQCMQGVRSDVNAWHKRWYDDSVSLAQKANIEPCMPRTCRRQSLRSNQEATTAEEYYRRVVTIPMLDHVLSQMTTRFSDVQKTTAKGFWFLPKMYLKDPQQARDNIMQLAEQYSDDLPASYDGRSSLQAELASWEIKMRRLTNKPNTILETVEQTNQAIWPIIFTLLHLLCTFPFSSCQCERSISCLRRLKSYVRSTMGQARLNALALLHTHYAMELDLDKIIDIFQALNPRRVLCSNILADECDADSH